MLGFDYGYTFEPDGNCDYINMTYWDDEYCNGTLLSEINLDISLVYSSLSNGYGSLFSSSGAVSIYPNCGGYDCIIEQTTNFYTSSDCSDDTPYIKSKTAYVDSLCTNVQTTIISSDGTTSSASASTMYTCNNNGTVKLVSSNTDSCSGGTTVSATLSSQECTNGYEYSFECGVATEGGTGIIIGGSTDDSTDSSSKANEIIISKWTILFIAANCVGLFFF